MTWLRLRRAAGSLAMLVAAASTVCAACATSDGKGADAPTDKGNLVGNPAPDFTVKAVKNGKGAVALKGLRGKVVLIDFWGTFCGPCKQSFPRLQELQARYGASGFTIVGISEDEAEDKGKIPGFADTYGAKFAIGWDEDKSIARSYELDSMPSSYIVDQKGVLRFAHVGYRDGDEVRVDREIKELLAQ
jgi:cytochrome c biogenesis protein CcmG/thiol:disulfide interchange protein DsbE